MGGEGGTASDHLPLTSDHQWVRRSVKYHSESNTVWLIEKGMYLIIHNKLWIFVEDRILSFSQWHEWFQHPLRVCFCWSAILQSVSFTYNCTNVDCIPVMKEVLVRRKKFYIRNPSAQEYLWNITIFTLWELFFWYLSNILESLFTMSRFCSWQWTLRHQPVFDEVFKVFKKERFVFFLAVPMQLRQQKLKFDT